MVAQKCALKNIIFSEPSDLFSEKLMQNLDDAWLRWLTPFVPSLPDQHLVINQLKIELAKIWK